MSPSLRPARRSRLSPAPDQAPTRSSATLPIARTLGAAFSALAGQVAGTFSPQGPDLLGWRILSQAPVPAGWWRAAIWLASPHGALLTGVCLTVALLLTPMRADNRAADRSRAVSYGYRVLTATLAVISAGLTVLLVETVAKPLVGRHIGVQISHPAGWLAFPSGHAAITMAFAASVLTSSSLLDRVRLWQVLGGTLLIASLACGTAMAAVRGHYPTDVVGGWLFGSYVAVIVTSAGQRAYRAATQQRNFQPPDV